MQPKERKVDWRQVQGLNTAQESLHVQRAQETVWRDASTLQK